MVRVGDIHSFDKTPLEVRDIAAAFGGTLLPAAQSILKQSILKTRFASRTSNFTPFYIMLHRNWIMVLFSARSAVI
jgi:hypothetical protein